MTPQQAIEFLRDIVQEVKDAQCVHQDDFGTHYADQEWVWQWEGVLDALAPLAEEAIAILTVESWIERDGNFEDEAVERAERFRRFAVGEGSE